MGDTPPEFGLLDANSGLCQNYVVIRGLLTFSYVITIKIELKLATELGRSSVLDNK